MIKPYSKNKKKVFISFVSADAKLAKALRSFIIRKFKGKIGVYLSSREMQQGRFSQTEVNEYLNKSHAVITLMTTNSLDSPWLYTNWKKQGLCGENVYVLKTEEVRLRPTDFKYPLESATINDTDSFTAFVQNFSSAFLGDDYPALLDDVKLFRFQIARVMSEMAGDKVKELIKSLEKEACNLPADDLLKFRIAVKLAKTGHKRLVREVLKKITDQGLRTELISELAKFDKHVAVGLAEE
jgi:hypothetical protein